MLGTKPVRLFTIASHKTNMRSHYNPRLGGGGSHSFYNWIIRLLLERVSAWCAKWSADQLLTSQWIKLVFSERGGHDYPALFDYLQKLEAQTVTNSLTLKARSIVPETIHRSLCDVRSHDALAGLQLADIAASAVCQAVNVHAANHDLEPAKALMARFAKEGRSKTSANFGLTLLPFQTQAPIPEDCRPFFELCGYNFNESWRAPASVKRLGG